MSAFFFAGLLSSFEPHVYYCCGSFRMRHATTRVFTPPFPPLLSSPSARPEMEPSTLTFSCKNLNRACSHSQKCDLEGRPLASARAPSPGAPVTAGSTDHGECYLVFSGLERTGHARENLSVTALFRIDAVHQIATVTSPLQASPLFVSPGATKDVSEKARIYVVLLWSSQVLGAPDPSSLPLLVPPARGVGLRPGSRLP